MNPTETSPPGQLNDTERGLLVSAIQNAESPPRALIEVGTWLGGGSTLHILRTIQGLGTGHLWGVEADPGIYEQMIANIRASAPEAADRFTPLFGFSQIVIPEWIKKQGDGLVIDFAFLDGGNNPREQIDEFELLDPFMPVGSQLMAHDAKLRKGKWLVPYMGLLDNWETTLHDVSPHGLFHARKIAAKPTASSLAKARSKLRGLALSPLEIAARFVPSGIAGTVARMLPASLREKIFHGY